MTYIITLNATLDQDGEYKEIENYLVGKIEGKDYYEADDKVQYMIDRKYKGDINNWIEDLDFYGFVAEAHFEVKEINELENLA